MKQYEGGLHGVATDLDGTLLRSDGSLSPAAIQVARRIEQGHLPFILVTARSPSTTWPIIHQLQLVTPVVCQNGAVTLMPVGSRRMSAKYLPPDAVLEVIELIASLDRAAIAVDGPSGRRQTVNWRDLAPLGFHDPEASIVDVTQLLLEPAFCLMVANHVESSAYAVREELKLLLPDQTVFSNHPRVTELTPNKANKLASLRQICDDYTIPIDSLVGFGDGVNDLDMLSSAGLAVAVANATPNVKDAADYTCPDTNDEDAVPNVLFELLRLGVLEVARR